MKISGYLKKGAVFYHYLSRKLQTKSYGYKPVALLFFLFIYKFVYIFILTKTF